MNTTTNTTNTSTNTSTNTTNGGNTSKHHHQKSECLEASPSSSSSTPAPSTSSPPYSYTKTRHYYTLKHSFEQSLDIYQPHVHPSTAASSKDTTSTSSTTTTPPTLILVTGSGWLGHAPWITYFTDYTNRQGPQYLCQELGWTIISIRHSGGFCQFVPSFSSPKGVLGLLLLISLMEITPQHHCYWTIGALTMLFIWQFLLVQGIGAADYPTMVQNVATAMEYIWQRQSYQRTQQRQERRRLRLKQRQQQRRKRQRRNNNKRRRRSSSSSLTSSLPPPSPIFLGGYSSGTHLVESWLREYRPFDNIDNNNDERDAKHVHGIVHISGILALWDCPAMNLITQTVFGQSIEELPSPLHEYYQQAQEVSQQQQQQQQQDQSSTSTSLLPYILIGCVSEVPSWLGTWISTLWQSTFGAPQLARELQQQGYHVQLHMLSASHHHHWNILSSPDLVHALQQSVDKVLVLSSSSSSTSNNNNHNNKDSTTESSSSGSEEENGTTPVPGRRSSTITTKMTSSSLTVDPLFLTQPSSVTNGGGIDDDDDDEDAVDSVEDPKNNDNDDNDNVEEDEEDPPGNYNDEDHDVDEVDEEYREYFC